MDLVQMYLQYPINEEVLRYHGGTDLNSTHDIPASVKVTNALSFPYRLLPVQVWLP